MKAALVVAEFKMPEAGLDRPCFMVLELFGKRVDSDCGHFHRRRELAERCRRKWQALYSGPHYAGVHSQPASREDG